MRKARVAILALFASALATLTLAQTTARPAPSRDKQVHLKHILVIGQTNGWEHDSVSDGMVAIYNMGRESGLWEAILRTAHGRYRGRDAASRRPRGYDDAG